MDIEIRISNPNQLDDTLKFDCDRVGIGSVGCVHKLPQLQDLLAALDKIEGSGREFRLITPFTPQKHLDLVINMIRELCAEKKDVEVTINDHGVLYACQSLPYIKNCKFSLGHFLSTTLEECPWHEHLLRDEDETMRDFILRCNMENKTKIELYRKYGVNCIESEMLPIVSSHFNEIRNLGVGVIAFLDHALVACSRSCQTAKFFGIKVPECLSRCDGYLRIRLKKIYDRIHFTFGEPSEEVRKLVPELYVCGNTIYRKIDNPNFDFTHVSILAFDRRLYSDDELSNRIREIQEIA